MTDSKLAKQAVLPRRALYKPAAGPYIAPIRKAAKKKKAKKR